jgi:uncharacterized protein YcbK (DUF882 family)
MTVGYRERMHRIAAAIAAAACAAVVATPSGVDATVSRGSALAVKKAEAVPTLDDRDAPPLLATLVQTHTDERVLLDETSPTADRFSTLLADRVTGEAHDFDPKLLDLLRALAKKHADKGPVRIELVSGYRSPKLNEMMRKKGRHVASHSQHSLGHAVDFRIVVPGEEKAIDPRVLEREMRELGWTGGVGTYPSTSDWFVHADVGPNRRWGG